MSDVPITTLLSAWKRGDRAAERALIEAIYPVLREIAGRQAAGGRPLTLSATDLAHEAYLRLQRQSASDWESRGHFFAIAAMVTRRVLVDYVRERAAEKRGGDAVIVSLDDAIANEVVGDRGTEIDWLTLNQALDGLAAVDPACARIVEMRVFGGMTVEDIARIEGTSVATVGRQWRFARAWLASRLRPD